MLTYLSVLVIFFRNLLASKVQKHHLLFLCQLIIRSHEGPDAREKRPGFGGMEEGYTVDHVVESGKLITLFSAPDYPQFQVYIESICCISCCPLYISCFYIYMHF